jgi:HEAT repeat protein
VRAAEPIALIAWIATALLCARAMAYPPPKIAITEIPPDMPEAIRAELVKLYSPDDNEVVDGIAALARMGETAAPAAPYLASILSTKHMRGPEQAAEALKKLGKTAVQPTILALQLSDFPGRKRAADVLAFYRDERAIDPLITAIDDWGPGHMSAALAAIGQAAHDRLVVGLSDPEPDVRARAARVLATFSDDRATEALVKAMSDPQPDVRLGALGSLCVTWDRRARAEGVALRAALGALKDPAISVRRKAVGIVAATKDARHLDALAGCLDDGDSDVRRAAATAVAHNSDRRAGELVLGMLGSRDPAIRAMAVTTLARSGDARAMAAVRALLRDPEPLVREQVVLALGAMLKGREAFDALSPALADAEGLIRRTAVGAMAGLGDERLLAMLSGLLADADESVRVEAARAIARTGGQPAHAILRRAMDNDRAAVRRVGLDALASLSNPSVDLVLTAMKDADPEVAAAAMEWAVRLKAQVPVENLRAVAAGAAPAGRSLAIRELAKTRDESNLAAFAAALEGEGAVAQAAVEAMIALGKPAVTPLRKVLKEGSPRGRRYARLALGRIDDPAAREALAAAIEQPVPVVAARPPSPQPYRPPVRPPARPPVVGPVAPIAAPRPVEVEQPRSPLAASAVTSPQQLADAMRRHPDAALYAPAADRLGAPCVAALTDLLKESDCRVRVAAVECLGRVRGPAAMAALASALRDPHWYVRRAAAGALGDLGDRSAVSALAAAAFDEHWLVRRDVAASLRKLGAAGP